jgi:hypothetical protein
MPSTDASITTQHRAHAHATPGASGSWHAKAERPHGARGPGGREAHRGHDGPGIGRRGPAAGRPSAHEAFTRGVRWTPWRSRQVQCLRRDPECHLRQRAGPGTVGPVAGGARAGGARAGGARAVGSAARIGSPNGNEACRSHRRARRGGWVNHSSVRRVPGARATRSVSILISARSRRQRSDGRLLGRPGSGGGWLIERAGEGRSGVDACREMASRGEIRPSGAP